MKVLIFSKHFWPDNFKINSIAKKLVEYGHQVTVITSNASYHNFKNKKKSFFFIKNFFWQGIDINYIPVFKKINYSRTNIIIEYFSYLISSFFFCHFFIRKKFDIIFVFGTSPIFQSFPAIYFSYLVRKPLILWVQDLWPDTLLDTGYVKNKFFLSIIKFFVKLNYLLSNLILVQSNNFKKKIKQDFGLKKKILTYYNLSEISFQKFFNLKNKKFTVVYSGNFGEAHDFDTLFKVMKLKKIQNLFYFKFIGSGKKFNYIKNFIRINKLSHCAEIKKYMSEKKLYNHLSMSDALFITLKKGLALDNTIPGKFQTYLAFGKPLLVNCLGVTNKLVIKHKIGLSNRPNDHNTLYNNLLNLKKLSLRDKLNIYKKSKALYEKYFEINTNVKFLEKVFYKEKS